MAGSDKILCLRELTAWYDPGKPVLSGLSLELREREVVGLIGLNGAGKTTLLSLLSGLHEDYTMAGKKEKQNPFRQKDFKRQRYTVFAEDASFSYFTFREYIAYVFAAYRKKVPDLTELLKGFHFEKYADQLLGELSMGNRKKVFLITAFALKPRLLLLDEPVNGLDFESTEYLYRQIESYRACGTLLFSSHILESITQTCDRVLVLDGGRIRQEFTPGEPSGKLDAEKLRSALERGSCGT